LAEFAHATSRISSTTPPSSRSAGSAEPTACSCSGTRRAPIGGYATGQPCDDAEAATADPSKWCPVLDAAHAARARHVEVGGQYADDRERAAVQAHGRAEHAGVGAETAAPFALADHQHVGRLCARFMIQESAPENRLDAEYGKQPVGGERRADLLRQTIALDIERRARYGGHAVEGRVPIAERREVLIRHSALHHAAFGVRRPDHHEPGRFIVRERPQHDGANHAEHAGCSADPDAEGEQQRQAERRPPRQQPCAGSHVPDELVHVALTEEGPANPSGKVRAAKAASS
jgi:hypothetical protein